MRRIKNTILHVYGVKPTPEKKIYYEEPPKEHRYEDTTYYFEKKVKNNMYLYRSKEGFRTCFDNFELKLKE